MNYEVALRRPRYFHWSKVGLVVGAYLAIAMMLCVPVFAQLNYGRIFGGVIDQTGGAIADATVTVVDVSRGNSRPLVSDGAGEYSAPSLLPGTYTVRVEAKGFKTVERQNVLVEVGQDVRIDVTLQPGEQTQTVTVTEAVPQMNTTNAQLGGTVENHAVNELPLNGRAFTKLLDYNPGIQAKVGGMSPAFSANGNRTDAIVWMVDGLDDLNALSASAPVAGGNMFLDEATILPLDAIQEVNIIANPNAQYGWKPGAQVNIGLKSGTNNMHGTLYAFGRDDAMDAKNPFLGPTLNKAADRLEQYGASIGGPVKKDKIFYFGDYEGQMFVVGSPKNVQIPTAASIGGPSGPSNSFPDAIAAMKLAGDPISQLSLNLAGCTSAGVCNAANGVFGNSTGSSTKPQALNNTGHSNNGVTKIDYHLNDHNSINGEYFIGQSQFNIASAGIQPYWLLGTNTRAQLTREVWIWTPNSNLVNEARFGYDRLNNPDYASECEGGQGQPDYATAFGFIALAGTTNPNINFPSCTPFPGLTITGFTALGASQAGQRGHFSTFGGIDTVSYTRGKHLFKFGVEIHDTNYVGTIISNNATGTLTFGTTPAFTGATPLEDFLAGTASTGLLLTGNATRNIKYNRDAVFAQDDWRIIPRLTLNLGLRYEYQPPISDANNLLGNFDASAPSGLIQQTSGHTVYNPDHLDFAPRIGLAWDVTGKGTTVVRSGVGIIYVLTPLQSFLASPQGAQLNAIPTGFALFNANGTNRPSPGNIQTGTVSLGAGQIPWAINTPVFNASTSGLQCGNGLGATNSNAITGVANPANPAPCKIAVINSHFPMAYVTTWTLGVQHAFTNNLTLNLAYVGTHGARQLGLTDINQPLLGATNGKSAPTSGIEQLQRPFYNQFPYFGQIIYLTGDQVSNYNALQMTLSQRVSHGVNVTAGYTFARGLDENSGVAQVMNSLNPQQDYANGTIVPASHFTLAGTWDIPGRKSPGQLLEGWQVNTALNILSGIPINAADTTSDYSGTGENLDRWTISGPPSAFQKSIGGVGTIPCFGVPLSKFAVSPCTTVAAGTGAAGSATFVANMPAACIAAATNEASGRLDPSLPIGATLPFTMSAPGITNAGTNMVTTGLQSLAAAGCYFENGAAIVPPAQGTFGTMGRDVFRDKAFSEWDFSATKTWKFRERYSAQFRAEFFNLLNRTQYAPPSFNPATPSTFGQSQSLPNANNPVLGNGGPREIQLGLKLIF